MRRMIAVVVVAVIVGVSALLGVRVLSCTAQPLDPIMVAVEDPNVRLREYKIADRVFHLEVAETPEQRVRGLMYRKSLPEDHGMLFPFEAPKLVSFWMKNTLIPLDMVFIRRGEVVHVLHDVPPCKEDPCPSYDSRFPVDTVVELPAGTLRRYRIQPGDRAGWVDMSVLDATGRNLGEK